MTRKDYNLIAAAIREARIYECDSPEADDASANVAIRIADALSRDNTRFDTELFLQACEVES